MSASPGGGAAVSVHIARESIGFAAAHFGLLEAGRETLHGHNYTVSLRLGGEVTARGTVVDFARLKAALRAECRLLDHRMLVPTLAAEVEVAQADGHVSLRCGESRFLFPAGDVVLLALPNTTCECLAEHLRERLRERLRGVGGRLEVTVEESPGQGASSAET